MSPDLTAALTFEDVADQDAVTAGPLVVTAEQLAAFVELTGEAHPLHVDRGVVPAGLVHSMVAGALVRAGGPVAVIGLRQMTWRFVAPVRACELFFARAEVASAQEASESIGLVKLRRIVTDANGEVLATGTVDLAVERRDA